MAAKKRALSATRFSSTPRVPTGAAITAKRPSLWSRAKDVIVKDWFGGVKRAWEDAKNDFEASTRPPSSGAKHAATGSSGSGSGSGTGSGGKGERSGFKRPRIIRPRTKVSKRDATTQSQGPSRMPESPIKPASAATQSRGRSPGRELLTESFLKSLDDDGGDDVRDEKPTAKRRKQTPTHTRQPQQQQQHVPSAERRRIAELEHELSETKRMLSFYEASFGSAMTLRDDTETSRQTMAREDSLARDDDTPIDLQLEDRPMSQAKDTLETTESDEAARSIVTQRTTIVQVETTPAPVPPAQLSNGGLNTAERNLLAALTPGLAPHDDDSVSAGVEADSAAAATALEEHRMPPVAGGTDDPVVESLYEAADAEAAEDVDDDEALYVLSPVKLDTALYTNFQK